MVDTTTVRRRLEHVQSITEVAHNHIDSPADQHALMRAIGLLEQSFQDLDKLEAEEERGNP